MQSGFGSFGRALLVMGVIIAAIGLLLILSERFPWLRLGRLPGDIRVERENFRFYFPIVTSLLLSVLLTLIFWLIRRR